MQTTIFMSIVSIIIFGITFYNIFNNNKSNYIYELIFEIIGIIVNFCFIIKGKQEIYFVAISNLFISIVIPIILILLDTKKINVAEIFFFIKYKVKKYDKEDFLTIECDKHPQSYIIHRTAAKYFEEQNDFSKSSSEYSKAIDLNKDDYGSYLGLANSLRKSKHNDLAVATLQELLRIKPNQLNGVILLSETYYDMNQFKEAINLLKKEIEIYPQEYKLYFNLGMNYTRINDFKNAKQNYFIASRIDDFKDISNLTIGQIDMIYRDYNEAEIYFMKAKDTDNQKISSDAYLNISKIRIHQNKKDLAIEYANIAIEIYPKIVEKLYKDETFLPIIKKLNIKSETKKNIIKKITKNQEYIMDYLDRTNNLVNNLTNEKLDKKNDREIEK